jgi:hypothetical protein
MQQNEATRLPTVTIRSRVPCPSCFDAEAERAGVRYGFTELKGRAGLTGQHHDTRDGVSR